MADVFDRFGGWVVAIIIAVIGLVGAIWPKRGSLEHQMIDQLQEQIEKVTSRVDVLESQAQTREQYIRRLEKRDRAWAERESAIRIGIANGTIPPWPPLDETLKENL